MTDQSITAALAEALDETDVRKRTELARAMRRSAPGAPTASRATFRLAVADYVIGRSNEVSARLVAAALDLSPEARSREWTLFDGLVDADDESPLRGVMTCLLAILTATALPIDARNVDALRDSARNAVALPVEFLGQSGEIVAHGVIVDADGP